MVVERQKLAPVTASPIPGSMARTSVRDSIRVPMSPLSLCMR
jgi:hypothetical protein